jgi:hypothetical protein
LRLFRKFLRMTLACTFGISAIPMVGTTGTRYKKMEGMHTAAQLNGARRRIAGDVSYQAVHQQFLTRVDQALKIATQYSAPQQFTVPGYYRNENAHIESSKTLTYNAYASYAAALEWQLTGDETYAEHARRILNDWATNNKSMPNANDDTPLVAAYGGVGLIHAATLLTDYPGWEKSEQEAFQTWLKTVYLPKVEGIVTRENNWADWGVLAVMSAYVYLGDLPSLEQEVKRLKHLIDISIDPDGRMPLETAREGNGMWYTYFALAPMTAACQVAYNAAGTNLFDYISPNGSSIQKALDFYLKYVMDPDLWEWWDPVDLNRPNLSSGEYTEEILPTNWPTNLYAAMASIYDDSQYSALVEPYQPVLGGWNERLTHHIAWCFPSLLPPMV